MPYRLPLVLGNDLAGTVVRVGSSVTRFAVGDEVYARPDKDRIGTFAELIAVHQDDLAPKPATLTMAEAASLPLVALTAWQALVERAHVQPGQKVLIHAGAGGLGSIAVQLAKALGAHVATTASTAKVDLVKDLGADVVIDYRTQDFAESSTATTSSSTASAARTSPSPCASSSPAAWPSASRAHPTRPSPANSARTRSSAWRMTALSCQDPAPGPSASA